MLSRFEGKHVIVNGGANGIGRCMSGKARVNCISPGWIETAACPEHSEEDKLQHPAGRVGKPEDIAEMVLYLCSDSAGFITGENISVDGGMSRLMIYHNDFGWIKGSVSDIL